MYVVENKYRSEKEYLQLPFSQIKGRCYLESRMSGHNRDKALRPEAMQRRRCVFTCQF